MITQQDNSLVDAICYLTDKSLAFNNISGSSQDFSYEAIENQLKLVLSEVQELVTAFKEEPVINVAAEAVDVIVTAVGLLQKLENAGINTGIVAERIADKNLEKFPKELKVAQETMKAYETNGVKTEIQFNPMYNVYAVKDVNDKVRKPIGFTSVELSDLTPHYLLNGFIKQQ